MQGKSSRTASAPLLPSRWAWFRWDGVSYAPSRIPALWLRTTDQRWEDARDQFGPLTDLSELIRRLDTDPDTGTRTYSAMSRGQDAAARTDAGDWEVMHFRLKAMAGLWEPSADHPDILCLAPFDALQHRDAAALRATLEMAAADGELVPTLEGWRLHVVPRSLRAFLLMACVGDVAARQRFRRCDHCRQWFPLVRTDTRFCTSGCRQAAHQASKVAA